MPEMAKLNKWVKVERTKGLVDMKFSAFNYETKLDLPTATQEEIAKEINEILSAPAMPDPDIF